MSEMPIFVVDPNRDERNELVSTLVHPMYRVSALSSGKDLLRKIKRIGKQIVILDLSITDTDPFVLINELREKCPEVQIITITHNATAKMRKRVAKAGVLFHSTKPKHLLQLKNILSVTLEFENRRLERAVV